jgi:O-antigen/teichoic acid export membrane protein
VVAVSSSFLGVLEAAQRFDLVNTVGLPASVSAFVLPLLGLMGGLGVPGIVALILISRLVTLAALVVFALRVFPELRRVSMTTNQLGRLTRYGGWVTVTSVVGPILTYLERFLVASLVSMAALSHYTASYEAVMRLLIVPISLTMSLFPAFSALAGTGARERLGAILMRSVKYVLLALAPLVLALVLFAEEILRIWLGSDFAAHSTVAMQILAVGLLVNSLAHPPYGLLQGIGRPDIPAKFHVLELGLYVPVAWFLVSRWGIAGAALAWTLRATVDAVLLFVATFGVCRLAPRLLVTNGVALASVAVVASGSAAYGVRVLSRPLPVFVQSALFGVLVGVCGWIVWRSVLETSDRDAIREMTRHWTGSRRALSE